MSVVLSPLSQTHCEAVHKIPAGNGPRLGPELCLRDGVLLGLAAVLPKQHLCCITLAVTVCKSKGSGGEYYVAEPKAFLSSSQFAWTQMVVSEPWWLLLGNEKFHDEGPRVQQRVSTDGTGL